MKRSCALSLVAVALFAILAQAVTAEGIKGTLGIRYNTRTQQDEKGNPKPGVKDQYVCDMALGDTVVIQGDIQHLPTLFSRVMGSETQGAQLTYNLSLILRNPTNLSQTVNVGKLVGMVPIDRNGAYDYGKGNLRVAVNTTGRVAGFDSKFNGVAYGKPPKNQSMAEEAKKQARTMQRKYQGKTVSLTLTNYDVMRFSDLVMAAGPVKSFPEVTLNGEMLYDYERNAWLFNGVTMAYQDGDKSVVDKLTGNIKWAEDPQRKVNGLGEYQFDIRVNEPEQAAGEAAAFQASQDESAFFAVDNTIPALTGTAKYKDQIQGEDVVKSDVQIDLVGNKLSRPQIVALGKLVWLVCVVPMNAE